MYNDIFIYIKKFFFPFFLGNLAGLVLMFLVYKNVLQVGFDNKKNELNEIKIKLENCENQKKHAKESNKSITTDKSFKKGIENSNIESINKTRIWIISENENDIDLALCKNEWIILLKIG